MLRESGYSRMAEPTSIIDVDDILLKYRIGLRERHQDMVIQFFGTKPSYIPSLEAALTGDRIIVDVACGTGEFTEALAKTFPNRTIGVDISQRAIEIANRDCKEPPNIEYVQGDVYQLTSTVPKEKAGLVTANCALHNFDELDLAVQQIYDSLGDEGTFFFTDMDPDNITADFMMTMIYDGRREMGDDAFVRQFVIPFLNDSSEFPKVAEVISTLAAYTKKEIETAMRKAGFNTINIEDADNCPALVGYAIK